MSSNSDEETQDMGLNDQPSPAQTPTQSRSSSGSVRTRGKSKVKWTTFGRPMPVNFNAKFQPLGKYGHYFNCYLISLAETPNLFPINIFDWRLMPKTRFEQAWTIYSNTVAWTREQLGLEEEGGIDIREQVRRTSEIRIGDAWRNYKYKLKRDHYIDVASGPRPIKCGDETIPEEHWNDLVAYWDSVKFKSSSEINTNNRNMMHMPHTAGSCNYATTFQNFVTLKGHEPDEMEFYQYVHQRKDNTWINTETEQRYDNMNAHMATLPHEIQGTRKAASQVFQHEFANKMVGHGRVLGHGGGVRPKDLGLSAASSCRGSKRTYAEITSLQAQISESQAKNDEKIRELQAQHDAEKAQHEAEKARHEAEKAQHEAEMSEIRARADRNEALLQQLLNRQMAPIPIHPQYEAAAAFRAEYQKRFGESWHTPLTFGTPFESPEQAFHFVQHTPPFQPSTICARTNDQGSSHNT